jgi:peptide/nickel transport system permease protein
VIVVPLAIGIGALQARREGSRGDRATTAALMSLASAPEFVVGVVLLVCFAVAVPILPVQSSGVGGGLLPHLRAMVLPALTLALAAMPAIARTARASIIETTVTPHYRAAVVRGLSDRALFARHVARNALIPTIALLGLFLGVLLGGSAVVETLFGYPGLGELLVTATQRKDIAVLAAGVMVSGILSLVALLAADIAFTVVDPRVRLAGARHG